MSTRLSKYRARQIRGKLGGAFMIRRANLANCGRVAGLAGAAGKLRPPTALDPRRAARLPCRAARQPMPLLQAVPGMNDILPAEAARWQAMEASFRATCERFGFSGAKRSHSSE